MKAIFFCNDKSSINRVYSEEIKAELKSLYFLDDEVYCKNSLGKVDFSDVEFIFSTWGMPECSKADVNKYLPKLKAVFYAAGSVQGFARPFLENGVKVFSAWQANAIPVVEYAVAQIVLANKGFFAMPNMVKADYKNAQKFFSNYKGNYKTKVGILGDGAIGSQVIDRLKAYRLEVYVYSIQMTEERAKEIGVKLSSLQEIFAECDVISNHLANNEQTKGIINAELIKSMKDYSTFINTGRGAQVDENALIEKLSSNPTVTAVLDVTCPEPPEKDSPLYTLNNVFLTPHIAGSSGNEVWRMAEYMLEESKRFVNGDKSLYEVSLKMLETMA